jgi:hypothetical protein
VGNGLPLSDGSLLMIYQDWTEGYLMKLLQAIHLISLIMLSLIGTNMSGAMIQQFSSQEMQGG